MTATRRTGPILLLNCIALLLAGLVAAPFVWMTIMSVTDASGGVTWIHYHHAWNELPFSNWLVNSLFLASAQTVLVVVLSSMGGFALAKYHFRGRRVIMGLIAMTALLPAQVLLPSLYEVMLSIGWIDSYAAIIVPGAMSVFGIFLFRQAMLGVPDELLQAGRVDGCSELRLWWDIALPIVRPMIAAFTLLSFLGAWNSYLWPQIILQSDRLYPLSIGLADLSQSPRDPADPGLLMAATLLSVLPVILLYSALQRDFVSGLTSGALKS